MVEGWNIKSKDGGLKINGEISLKAINVKF